MSFSAWIKFNYEPGYCIICNAPEITKGFCRSCYNCHDCWQETAQFSRIRQIDNIQRILSNSTFK